MQKLLSRLEIKNLIDELIKAFLKLRSRYCYACKIRVFLGMARKSKDNLVRLDEGDIPREFKKSLLLGSHGLGCITHAEVIRKNSLVGDKVYLHKIHDQVSFIEVRNQDDADLVSERFKNV